LSDFSKLLKLVQTSTELSWY